MQGRGFAPPTLHLKIPNQLSVDCVKSTNPSALAKTMTKSAFPGRVGVSTLMGHVLLRERNTPTVARPSFPPPTRSSRPIRQSPLAHWTLLQRVLPISPFTTALLRLRQFFLPFSFFPSSLSPSLHQAAPRLQAPSRLSTTHHSPSSSAPTLRLSGSLVLPKLLKFSAKHPRFP